jgi:hypothetical protein
MTHPEIENVLSETPIEENDYWDDLCDLLHISMVDIHIMSMTPAMMKSGGARMV